MLAVKFEESIPQFKQTPFNHEKGVDLKTKCTNVKSVEITIVVHFSIGSVGVL